MREHLQVGACGRNSLPDKSVKRLGKGKGERAGELGFEPRLNGPEPFVLPLHYSPESDEPELVEMNRELFRPPARS